MRQLVTQKKTQNLMDQTDILYIIEILNDAISDKDWDKIDEALETLKEFLDGDDSSIED